MLRLLLYQRNFFKLLKKMQSVSTKIFSLLLCMLVNATFVFAQVQTQRVYLSGTGSDNTVAWDFMVTDGMNAGKWGRIAVPSCWETQGYGKYQYGIRFYGKAFPDGIANEKGQYKYEFEASEKWRGNQVVLVFEAVMTDADVKVNGRRPGVLHQGGFYRFSFDVTDFLKYGKKNLLEVEVSKESSNASVNLAERRADYWNFGGIIRPVFLEIKPAVNIARVAIHADASGNFQAGVFLNRAVAASQIKTEIIDGSGKILQTGVNGISEGGDQTISSLKVNKPYQWSAEIPVLYTARFSLLKDGKTVHQLNQKFGFRTIEVKPSDGLYLNGVKINIRGVNRHSFRPETGRTLSYKANLEDVLLIKSMHMNAVRLSHYPADPEFLALCDSLGLYVMNELGGWHGKYDTPTGTRLIKSLVERDVNHPSVIWWSNGNEGGWNTELDGEFAKHDPQKRPVVHPQGNFGGFETMHYRSYGESQNYMRKPEIFMPTEFLHGLYDGGHGAGLYDYWEMMRKHPRCAGGFLWVLADEGLKRTDLDGLIDNQGNYGADGIVGPHHEKEGSFFTIREIWNPVQIKDKFIDHQFDGNLSIENRYDFLNLNTCRFAWKQVSFPASADVNAAIQILKQGEVKNVNLAPHTSGMLNLNTTLDPGADAILLSAYDYRNEELWTWSVPVKKPAKTYTLSDKGNIPEYTEDQDFIRIKAGNKSFAFSKKDGQLKEVKVAERLISFGNGPRFIAARRSDRSLDQFYNHDDEKAKEKDRTYTEFTDAGVFSGFDIQKDNNKLIIRTKYKFGNLDEAKWTISPDGELQLDYRYNFSAVVDLMGIRFDYPEEKMQHKKWLGAGPYRVWQNRIHGTVFNIWKNDYNDPVPGESFTYPEFKGYFANVSWMNFGTTEGQIRLINETPDTYVGVYQPRDGRDRLLYTLPESGISILNVIPAVRNKVNASDLIGPASQPKWVDGSFSGRVVLCFD